MAVAASILTAIYHMLKDGTRYQDLGPNHFDACNKERQKNRALPCDHIDAEGFARRPRKRCTHGSLGSTPLLRVL